MTRMERLVHTHTHTLNRQINTEVVLLVTKIDEVTPAVPLGKRLRIANSRRVTK